MLMIGDHETLGHKTYTLWWLTCLRHIASKLASHVSVGLITALGRSYMRLYSRTDVAATCAGFPVAFWGEGRGDRFSRARDSVPIEQSDCCQRVPSTPAPSCVCVPVDTGREQHTRCVRVVDTPSILFLVKTADCFVWYLFNPVKHQCHCCGLLDSFS